MLLDLFKPSPITRRLRRRPFSSMANQLKNIAHFRIYRYPSMVCLVLFHSSLLTVASKGFQISAVISFRIESKGNLVRSKRWRKLICIAQIAGFFVQYNCV